MTPDQQKALLRSFISAFGGALGTFFLTRGWIDQDQLTWLADNGVALLGLAGSVGAGIWTMISRRKVNMVATVAAMPEVSAVQTTRTPEGAQLAASANVAAGDAGTVQVVNAGAKP